MSLRCTVMIDGDLCGQVAVDLLRVTPQAGPPQEFPRCGEHPATGYARAVRKVYPGTRIEIIPLEPEEPQEKLHGDCIEITFSVPGSDMAPVRYVRKDGEWRTYALSNEETWEPFFGSVLLTDAVIGDYLTGLIARHVEMGTGGMVLEADGSR